MKHVYSVLLLFLVSLTWAQRSPTLYPMENIFQNQFNNPAYEPLSKVSLNLASTSVDAGFTGFALGQFIDFKDEGSGTLDIPELIGNLGKNNQLILKNSTTVFGLGFKVKNFYLQASARVVSAFRFNLPKSLMTFALEGNGAFIGEDNKADFSALNVNLSSYAEAGIALSLPIGDKIRVGARAKYLSGLTNITTEKNELTVHTDNENYGVHIRGAYALRTSNIDISNPEAVMEEVIDAATQGDFKNTGFALDLGAQFKISDRLKVSGALTDLGVINWTNRAKLYKNDNLKFDYEGEDLYDYVEGNGDSGSDVSERVLDSLINAITFDEQEESYSAAIPASILLGGEFKLANGNYVGAVATADYVPGIFVPAFTGYYRLQIKKFIGLSISNAFAYKSFVNPGAAISLKLGPIQIFAASDNLLGLVAIENTRSASGTFGINLVFGGDDPLKDLVAPE